MLFALALPGRAETRERPPSNYEPFKGAPFFLLSDTSYGSADVARVRLEVPERDAARAGLEAYSGVDIVVYRVPQPLEFLKKQRNLHRIEVTGNYRGEGLANTLRHLWDTWWKESRLVWRKLFSAPARRAVTEAQPGLATSPAIHRPTVYAHHPQYKPIKGFDMVDSFRYPLWHAKPIEPPPGVKLEGSSSEFIDFDAGGNVMIPIGKRAPGLYLVEAMIGEHRATTLVFVSDTVAVTKISSGQMLAWTARRDNGAAVANASVAWSDGAGILQSSRSGADGVAILERASPEHTYLLGEDPAGGVFVSENFYYDSEIYNTKIYAVTDRPLYRPGDEVNIKILARNFVSARVSQAATAGPIGLTLVDPNGTPVLTQTLQLSPDTGAETRLRLPESAGAGGYELRMRYGEDTYGAAFRVAEYIKPHFEIDVRPSRTDFKTGDTVTGTIALRYPDGKPVKRAHVSISLRSQKNTMVEGELRYGGMFPIELKTEELRSDDDGNIGFTLPAAADPSRYILTVLATDGAAYRVKTTRELLVERASTGYQLRAARNFSEPGQRVRFALTAQGPIMQRPTRWELIRLESQTKTGGAFDPNARHWDLDFPGAGSYQLNLRDERGNLLAAASHWVAGDGVKAAPGSIEIVLDRARYAPGDIAEALITFPEPVQQALLTLERDKVEQHGLVAGDAPWYQARRVAPRQWRVRMPVRAEHGPNMTFSVAYVRNGEFVFENAGLEVIEPRIALQFSSDKEVYQPGETVTLDVFAQLDGKPLETLVTLGVVDEMIYVLQPEIAPDIGDFFHHLRRNNVRTTASLAFISYDMAQGRGGAAPARHNYNERGVKVLERPRRAEVDTAFWAPALRTGANGRARVSFVMPDALTRWRITGRAMDAQGRVGQRSAYLRSDKAFYTKWTAPDWMREGDAPRAAIAVFNQTGSEQPLDVILGAGAQRSKQILKARPGVNYTEFALAPGAGPLRLEIHHAGKLVDALDAPMHTLPQAWSALRTQTVALNGVDLPLNLPLNLPPDARNVRLSFAAGAASHFARIADDLIAYPYGCVEQTASRLIPLTMALHGVGAANPDVRERLTATLQAQRLRLVAMAGPQAVFGWWGNASREDPLITAYAYYADWLAARALGIALPPEHWNNVVTVYQKHGPRKPLLERALVLWLAQEMGLPTRTLAAGLVEEHGATQLGAPARRPAMSDSLVLGATPERGADAMGLGLLAVVAAANEVALPAGLQAQVDAARKALAATRAPAARALLMLGGQLPAAGADSVLAAASADLPTIDRALALIWVQKVLGGAPPAQLPDVSPSGAWRMADRRSGMPVWHWADPKALPARLQLAAAPPAGTVAMLQFESRAPLASNLPLQVRRRILRMQTSGSGYTLQPLKPDETLRTDELYMDEITLTPAAGATTRFGLVEVALPPGASVEATTWGIDLLNGAKREALERARHVERRDGYAVPIDLLEGEIKVRHLLRFAQKGRYRLPPARFYRMYQPNQFATERPDKAVAALRVE
ncbi:alpha-2-macroglobulin [Massilia sp. YIM B02443]|uniref:alpha-2-macroglobulin family protein n=1 Tax=Massilia sp. YIM B02443 TaxID=3050127 RepID=UPI0025B63D69|nr:alpha-2-macroglobulin [Massilia sp. YIM B02443]MDN4038140.1 alpha-2-macroglobulin [Massilia sp. YIM B02443]